MYITTNGIIVPVLVQYTYVHALVRMDQPYVMPMYVHACMT